MKRLMIILVTVIAILMCGSAWGGEYPVFDSNLNYVGGNWFFDTLNKELVQKCGRHEYSHGPCPDEQKPPLSLSKAGTQGCIEECTRNGKFDPYELAGCWLRRAIEESREPKPEKRCRWEVMKLDIVFDECADEITHTWSGWEPFGIFKGRMFFKRQVCD